MEEILIRRATREDARSWLSLRNALWPSEDHASEIARFFDGTLDEPQQVLLAFRCGEPIALVELSTRHDVEGTLGVRTGYIEGLYVVPAARSFRLNRHLINMACDWALNQHCRAFASDRSGRLVFYRKLRCEPV